MTYRLRDVRPIRMLEDRYGRDIELQSGGERPETYRLLAEFAVKDRLYAVLQSERMEPDDEYEVFRIVPEGEEFRLETVVDDDEWENIAELYDEMTVSFEED